MFLPPEMPFLHLPESRLSPKAQLKYPSFYEAFPGSSYTKVVTLFFEVLPYLLSFVLIGYLSFTDLG